MMTRLRARIVEPLLLALLGLPLVRPLFHAGAVACTHDGHLYYHWVAALRHGLAAGQLFSRWQPDVAFGLGYPYFLYREALPLLPPLFLYQLGVPLPAALNLFYIGCLLAAGQFMRLWVRDLLGPAAGLVSGVAYMAAPYLLLDALVRGNQPESLALALLPLLLWAGRRFVHYGTLGPFLWSVGGLAALGLSHNISLLIFGPTLALYLLAVALPAGDGAASTRARLGRAALVVALGGGLVAFYAGAAVAEIGLVTLTQAVSSRNNSYAFNFLTLREISAAVPPHDPTLLNGPLLLRLGWAPAGLALLGLLLAPRLARREQRIHVLLVALAAAVYLFMALAISRPVWDRLPLIEFVQFPWRFVGRAALPVAFLAGVPVALLAQRRSAGRLVGLAAAAAVALLLLEALPNLYPALCPQDPTPTIVAVHAYERETGMVGVDPEGHYFPRTVAERPAGSVLEADYLAGRPPQRFDATRLPPGGVLQAAEYEPNRAELLVETPAPFTARYWTFAFPGWEVRVDGVRVPVTPSDPEGVMTFGVPAGVHTISIRWGTTPLRTLLGALSLLALAATGLAALVLADTAWRRSGPPAPERLRPGTAALIAAAGVVVLLLLLWPGDGDRPWRRSAGPPLDHMTDVGGAGLQLAGNTLSGPDDAGLLTVDLAWRVGATPDDQYQSNLWLADATGAVWSDKETARPRGYADPPAMVFWPAGAWAWDSRELQLLPGTPPGTYDLVLTLFRLADLSPVTLTAGDGRVLGPTTVIGQVTVGAVPAVDLAPAQPAAQIDGLRLVGYALDRQTARPGDPLLVTLFWQGDGAGAEAVALTLRAGERVAASWSLPPLRADYPPAAWPAGVTLRGQHLLRLPAALEAGSVAVTLGDFSLGDLRIEAPERIYVPPATAQPLDVVLGAQARLAGASLAGDCVAAEGLCAVTLLWQGLAEMPLSYRVFVHLVDGAGQIVAQADGEPAGWARPTSGWAPGEYVVDAHMLVLPAALPAGTLTLRVGLYDPQTGRRLTTAAGEDAVPIDFP